MRGPRTAMKSGPHLPQLEKALAQKRRPNTAKNKINKLKKKIFKKKKNTSGDSKYMGLHPDFHENASYEV